MSAQSPRHKARRKWSLVERWNLGDFSQLWASHYLTEVGKVERVQGRAQGMIKLQERLIYEERLKTKVGKLSSVKGSS